MQWTISSYHGRAGGRVFAERWVEPAGRAIRAAAIEATVDEAEGTMALARSYTPVRTGDLQSTGHVRRVSATVTMSFGGRAASGRVVRYAVWVHEMTWLRHRIGSAKFLERAVNERRRGADARIAQGIAARVLQNLARTVRGVTLRGTV